MKKVLLFLSIIALVIACAQDELTNPLDVELQRTLRSVSPNQDISYFILPGADDLKAIPQDVANNPLSLDKIELGKMLFFETGLANDALHADGQGTYSCATCHVPSAAFTPGSPQGIADGGLGFGLNGEGRIVNTQYGEGELDVQGARPLSLLNVAYVTNTTWSGKFGGHDLNEGTEYAWDSEEVLQVNHLGYAGLESQNIEGLGLHRMQVNAQVVEELGYTELFDQAFPDFPEEERYTTTTASFAISAYLRSLTTTEAPFQHWLKGDYQALTDREKEGAILFFGKAGCYRCHSGPALNSNAFYALGVKDLYRHPDAVQTDATDKRNLGRGGFTGKAEDMYKFKVPGIYNMADVPFYYHGSSHQSLWSLVQYFNLGKPENPDVPREQLAKEFHPLYLSAVEMESLIKFLSEGLRDPNLERHVPESVLSGQCFPNNDPKSVADLGCE